MHQKAGWKMENIILDILIFIHLLFSSSNLTHSIHVS